MKEVDLGGHKEELADIQSGSLVEIPPHTQVRACPGETEGEATEGVSLGRLLG